MISFNLPGVPINKFTPSSSIFRISAFTSTPPTNSIGLTFGNVEINGSATLNICDDNSLVGEIIIPITCCKHKPPIKRQKLETSIINGVVHQKVEISVKFNWEKNTNDLVRFRRASAAENFDEGDEEG